jgi:hypothetical protein
MAFSLKPTICLFVSTLNPQKLGGKLKMKSLTLLCLSLIFIGLLSTVQVFAKIDPETAIGMWLFEEDTGKIAADSSGKGQ